MRKYLYQRVFAACATRRSGGCRSNLLRRGLRIEKMDESRYEIRRMRFSLNLVNGMGPASHIFMDTLNREMLSQRVRQVKPSGIRKFFDIINTMPSVISLGVGEPDFVTPEHIRQAGIRSIELGHTRYTSNYGMLELWEEIAAMLHRRY